MSLFAFVKKLLPRVDRTSVAEDLRTTEKEIQNVAIPSWEAAVEFFKLNKPKSQEMESLRTAFYHEFDLRGAVKSSNLVQEIQKRLNYLLENVVYAQELLDSEVERDIITSGLTARKALILRTASNLSMISRYLPALLNYLYMAEAKAVNKSLEEGLQISKAEVKWVENHFKVFANLFSKYGIPKKEFEKYLKKTPDIYVGGQAGEIAATGITSGTVDPFEELGMAGFVGNPIYRVRMVIAKWQNDRYESAKAKKRQLELRLLYLKSQTEGEENAQLVNEIDRLQARIEKYDSYLREVEEDLGVHDE